MTIKIKHKRGTASNITSANPTLAAGELAFETDTRRFKVGDGSTAWSSLAYVTPYLTATDRILGRSSSGAGAAEEITCTAFGRSLIDDADAAAARTTLSVQPTASPAFTGTVLVGISSALNSSDGVQVAAANNPGVIIARTAAPSNTNSIAGVNATSYDGSAYVAGATINFRAAENWSSTNHGTDIQFRTTPTGSGGSLTETLRLTGAGQLLVTAGSASAPGVAFSGDTNTGLAQIGGADTASVVTAGVERVRVDASGRVGIGVTPASAGSSALQVRGDVDIFGNGSDRSVTYNVGVGDDGITGWYRAKIAFVPSGAANNISQHISFWNKDGDNGGSTLTERMRIANDGKIYGYSVYATTVGATNRDLFIDSGGLIGYVSSIRASKTNIAAIDDVSWLRDLTPVSFHYRKRNEDGTYSDEADGTLDYGLIAEDVEPVAPEMCFYDVVDGEPQLRGVHYSKLITPMLRYIQQLEQRIAALEERNNA